MPVEKVHIDDDPIKGETATEQFPPKDVSNLQHKILDIARNIAEEERSVDEIVYDAKLRIQQLQNESNQLEQNFQSYLERRKRCQEQANNNNNEKSKIHTLLKDLHEVTTDCLRLERRKTNTFDEDEEWINEELQSLKEKLHEVGEPNTQKTAKSDSSTSSLELKNAILEAKLKFFEHETTLRKCREQENEIHTGNLLQKQLEKYFELQKLQDFASEKNANFEPQVDTEAKLELNTDSSLSEININDKTLDEEQDIDLSPMTDQKSQKSEQPISASIRKELFPKHSKKQNDDLQAYLTNPANKCPKQSTSEKNPTKKTTSELIKQSMAKMQLLFEQQTKSQETLKEIVNELQQEKTSEEEELKTTRQLTHPNETLDKSFSTTIISETTTKTSEDSDIKHHSKISQRATSANCNSHSSQCSVLNASKGSEGNFEISKDHFEETLQRKPVITEFKELEISIPSHENEVEQVTDSSVSSDLQLASKSENDAPQSTLPDFNLNVSGNENEIGQILTPTDRKLNVSNDKLFENFSSRSSSDLEISVGHQNIDAKNLADDSESDFWA